MNWPHKLFLVLMLGCQTVSGARVDFGTVNLGYQKQDAFCPARVSVDEISSYVARLRAVCMEQFAKAESSNAFDVVVLVHREHAHVWLLAPKSGDIAQSQVLQEALRRVVLPRLNQGPIAFSIEVRIGGEVVKRIPFSPPPVPKEWTDVLSKSKLSQPIAFDDFVQELCPS